MMNTVTKICNNTEIIECSKEDVPEEQGPHSI